MFVRIAAQETQIQEASESCSAGLKNGEVCKGKNPHRYFTPQLVSHFMNFSFISKHEGCAESDPASSKLSCSYDLKYEVRSNERKDLMADKFVITAKNRQPHRVQQDPFF